MIDPEHIFQIGDLKTVSYTNKINNKNVLIVKNCGDVSSIVVIREK
jgi:hypothetical protein